MVTRPNRFSKLLKLRRNSSSSSSLSSAEVLVEDKPLHNKVSTPLAIDVKVDVLEDRGPRVHFSHVQVRVHRLILGDHIANEFPLSLGK
jgi:hypothetical protein